MLPVFRSANYREWIKKQNCAYCGKPPGLFQIHGHHEPLGLNRVGGKPPDTHLIPLCPSCHQDRHENGPAWFNNVIDVKMIIIRQLTRYLEEKRQKERRKEKHDSRR